MHRFDWLIRRIPEGHLLSSTYRKLPHQERCLDFKSEHPVQHKQYVVYTLFQRFPTGGFQTPGDRNKIFRGPEGDFRGLQICMFLKVPFFKRSESSESLHVLLLKRTLSSLIVPVNVTDVAIHIKCVHCYLCFMLQLPRRRWPVMRLQEHSDFLNVYESNMASSVAFLFDATELERFWCSTEQSYQKLCTKARAGFNWCEALG